MAAIRGLSLPSISELESLGTETGPSVVTDLGEYLYETSNLTLERTTTSLSRPISYDGSDGLLQERLSEAIEATRRTMVLVAPEKKGFVPRQQQVRIMNESWVAEELSRVEKSFRKRIQFWNSMLHPRRIEEDASAICASLARHPDLMGNHEQRGKSFRKVFATLLLIDRPGTIRKFIDEGVCDADLPLRKLEAPGKNAKTFSLCRKGAPGVSLSCFEGWKRTTLVQFERYQWKLLAPFFSRGEEDKAKHYNFQDEVILPFTYQKHIHGGVHGEVFKVQIHPEHHDFNKHKVSLPLALDGTGYLQRY